MAYLSTKEEAEAAWERDKAELARLREEARAAKEREAAEAGKGGGAGALAIGASDLAAALRLSKKPAPPDTSATPPNVSQKEILEERRQEQKHVQRTIEESLRYFAQKGWQSSFERQGTRYRVFLWHRTEGGGDGGELPPPAFQKETLDQRTAAIARENEKLRGENERLTTQLGNASVKLQMAHEEKTAEGLTIAGEERIAY